jgi:hypothetical protein
LKGKCFTKVGRETLVKTVMLSQPIDLSVDRLPGAEMVDKKKIDRLRRAYLWSKRRAHKEGLGGIPDLERFARALHLRWMWFR